MATTIYGLHSGDGEIRYVGQTIDPISKRLSGHRSDSKTWKSKVNRWIAKHFATFDIVELVVVGDSQADAFETSLVAELKASIGTRCMNIESGGKRNKTYKGRTQTPESNSKRSKALKGVPKSESHRRNAAEAQRGRPCHPNSVAASMIKIQVEFTDQSTMIFDSRKATADHFGVSTVTINNWINGGTRLSPSPSRKIKSVTRL